MLSSGTPRSKEQGEAAATDQGVPEDLLEEDSAGPKEVPGAEEVTVLVEPASLHTIQGEREVDHAEVRSRW